MSLIDLPQLEPVELDQPLTPDHASDADPAAPRPRPGSRGVLATLAEGLAALVLEGAALALHTTAAVIWPVQTAAEVMTRAAHDSGGSSELGPWLPAGVAMVPLEHPRPGGHNWPAAPRRHLSAVPNPRPGPSAGLPVARGSGG